MKISLIIPSRNNLRYLKWSYDSIRKNQGKHEVEICVADDASTDGTWEWCETIMESDSNFKAIRNEGPKRLGLVILNDKLINEVASHDICMVYHADMYLMPGAIDQIEHKLKDKTIVSLTRIEPSLHPPGPEKMLFDCGIEPHEFDEQKLLDWFSGVQLGQLTKMTEGIFAPWAFYKKDFQEIGGHDTLFAPQSKEDSDIFNRFQLNGIKFIQTWGGCVYHLTCRGSRFNTFAGGAPGQDSQEWQKTNYKNMRNFIRKWGHSVKHDEFMKPVIPPKYDIGIILKNASYHHLEVLEPWCNIIYYERSFPGIETPDMYADREQLITSYIMQQRVKCIEGIEPNNGILVEVDGKNFTQQDYQYITQLAEVLDNEHKGLEQELIHFSDDPEFELGNLMFIINSLKTYEKDLIICK